MFFGGIFWLIAVVCAVLVIYDVLTRNKKLDETVKVVWIVAAVVFSVVTAIVYYLVYYVDGKKL